MFFGGGINPRGEQPESKQEESDFIKISGNQCSINRMSGIDVALASHLLAIGVAILSICADRVNLQPSLE